MTQILSEIIINCETLQVILLLRTYNVNTTTSLLVSYPGTNKEKKQEKYMNRYPGSKFLQDTLRRLQSINIMRANIHSTKIM